MIEKIFALNCSGSIEVMLQKLKSEIGFEPQTYAAINGGVIRLSVGLGKNRALKTLIKLDLINEELSDAIVDECVDFIELRFTGELTDNAYCAIAV